MTGKIGNYARLQHILEAINNIENFVLELSFSKFLENELVKSAVVRQLEIIGEASNHLTADVKLKYKEVDWKQIIGIRNIIAHEYFIIDDETVWEIVKNDIPYLKSIIIKIINEEFTK